MFVVRKAFSMSILRNLSTIILKGMQIKLRLSQESEALRRSFTAMLGKSMALLITQGPFHL